MASYGVKVAFGVFVDARSLLYLTIAWSKGLAAAHELCTRLSAEASVRRLGATPQEPRSAAERLPPEIWALIRNALVLQTVEAVECDLVRRTLCLTCQDDPGRNRWVSTLAELLTCGDCMSKASGTDLDLRWRRLRGADGHEQATRSLLDKFGLEEETALPLICQSSDASFDPEATCPIVLSRNQERTAGMICANVWGNSSDPDRGQVRRIEQDFFRLPADAAARFAKLFRMFPSLRAVDLPPHTPTPAPATGGLSNTPSAGPSTADTSSGGEGRRAAPYRPHEPRWMLLSGYCE
ncbi:hypothetical protein JCM8115_005844 [Rhodotorula mucilaginosa]|nr:hypothetical protein B0A53_01071 [Rhodotorula sp. CCFEE 5036]